MAKDDPDRDARLAEALRANLRRRKAQARAAGQSMFPGESRGPGMDATGPRLSPGNGIEPETER